MSDAFNAVTIDVDGAFVFFCLYCPTLIVVGVATGWCFGWLATLALLIDESQLPI